MSETKSARQTRQLSVYPIGDFWQGKLVPQIRLQGKWLEAAGIRPGDRVVVEVQGDGHLHIQRLERRQP